MNAMIRSLKGPVALGALAGLGLGLRWMTAGAVGTASTSDLTSMASLAIGAVGWIAYGWLLIAVLATVLEQAPGAVGRSSSVVAGWITSPGSRALLRSALGIAAATPLTIGVAHAAPGDGAPQQSVQRTWTAVEKASSIQLANTSSDPWRAMEKASTVHLTGQPQDLPTARPKQNVADGPGRQSVVPGEGRQDVAPVRLGVPDRPTEGAPTRYTTLRSGREIKPKKTGQRAVRAGDSLWALAAAELGPNATDPAVAARWPHWYAANLGVIGPDPDLIHPGQVLRIPGHLAGQPVPPTHQEK
jgi:nucleoid-associated protein YgaU